MPDLSGRVAVVTGAGRGQGRAEARALAAAGADLVCADLCADLPDLAYSLATADDLAATVAGVAARGRRALAVVCDVRRAADVTALAERTLAAFGRIDILVNNAGACDLTYAHELSETRWALQIDTNLRGPWLCARAAIPAMTAQGWGRIINIAAVAALVGLEMGAHYAAAKAGVLGLTRSLARELAPAGITVNAICPGTVDTPLITGLGAPLGIGPPTARAAFSQAHLRGTPIAPEDIAAAVVFLASEGAGRITGHTLTVDDGWTMY